MNDKTILVIDDSATIRKVVDSSLSPLGYHVILAPTAEEGVQFAIETNPDLILLDHQLPGTTGFEVCRQLLDLPAARNIPVVTSSTLRKRAYAEYTDLPNVVDMLPKPYSAELLITTVSNALETGALIVRSQSQGTAVPEVMQEVGDADLQGSLQSFGLRAILDFLNNGEQCGTLEVQADHLRVWFHLDKGRIQGVLANKIEQADLIEFLPEPLRELAPVLNLTSAGGSCAQMDGLVQLLDRKVLDPRLLAQLLRYQAALLVWRCCTRKLDGFRFEVGGKLPPLCSRLPLDISLLALVVDGALRCDASQLPDGQWSYVRNAIRGHNLDRTGLAAQHMKFIGLLSEPRVPDELARLAGCPLNECRRVLFALTLAELVQQRPLSQATTILAYEPDAVRGQAIRRLLAEPRESLHGKVVRDRVALQLALRRMAPDVVLFAADDDDSIEWLENPATFSHPQMHRAKWIVVVPDRFPSDSDDDWRRLPFAPDATLTRPYTTDQLVTAIREVLRNNEQQPSRAESTIRESTLGDRRDVLQGAV